MYKVHAICCRIIDDEISAIPIRITSVARNRTSDLTVKCFCLRGKRKQGKGSIHHDKNHGITCKSGPFSGNFWTKSTSRLAFAFGIAKV